MTKIIISLLLIAPVFAGAAPAKTEAKINVYQTITDDLLKDCTGVNKTIAVAGFSYSDGHDSRDGGVGGKIGTAILSMLRGRRKQGAVPNVPPNIPSLEAI